MRRFVKGFDSFLAASYCLCFGSALLRSRIQPLLTATSPAAKFDAQAEGQVNVSGPVRFDMIGLTPGRWLAGSRHDNIVGPLVLQATSPAPRVVTMPASKAATLCGKSIDWLEMP